MKSIRQRASVSALALAALCAALAAPSGAQQQDKPVPCNGLLSPDPTGDQQYYLAGFGTGAAAPANGDSTGLFVNRTEKKTTVGLVIAKLDKTIPGGAQSNVYRVFYELDGEERFLEAEVDSGGNVTYVYGILDPTPTSEGETTGKFVEGESGVVAIDVPGAAGGKAGMKWENVYAFTSYSRGLILTPADYVPDDGTDSTLAYNGAQCSASGGGETPPPPATGTPTPGPAPSDPNANRTAFKVTLSPSKLKAKKVKKAKSVAFTAQTTERVTDVTLTLKKGAKTLGTAKASQVEGTAKLVVKLAKKGLKKGTYRVLFAGKRSDGSAATATAALKVK